MNWGMGHTSTQSLVQHANRIVSFLEVTPILTLLLRGRRFEFRDSMLIMV